MEKKNGQDLTHLRPHQWKPGQSGNPRGRPKGVGLTERLRALLQKDDGRAMKAIVQAGVKAALGDPANGIAPDFRFWKEIFDRCEGTIAERMAEEGGAIFFGVTTNGKTPDKAHQIIDVEVKEPEEPEEEEDAEE